MKFLDATIIEKLNITHLQKILFEFYRALNRVGGGLIERIKKIISISRIRIKLNHYTFDIS